MKHFYLKFTKKTLIHLCLGISLLVGSQAMVAQKTSAKTGLWTDAATWVGGAVPNTTELVTIAAGHTVDFSLTAVTTIGSLSIESGATLNITGTFSRNIGNIIVFSGGTFISTGTGSTTINADTNVWTNNGTFTASNIGTGTVNSSRTIVNNGTMSLTSGIGSTSKGIIKNINGGTLTFTGTIAGIVNNFGTMNAAGLSGNATTAVLNNKSTGVLNFSGSSMTASLLVLNASDVGNTVNYNLAGSQTVKIPSTHYNKLILSNSGTKTIATPASGTLCTGKMTITGTAKANVTNANVAVNMLILGTTGQVAGTIGISGSGATTTNSTYFVTGTGTLNVQNPYAITSTAAGGDWNTPSTWVDGVVPSNSSADYVVIVSGSPVSLTLGAAFTVGALNIHTGGTLNVTGAFTFAIASRIPYSNIAGNFNLDSTTGSKSFGNLTVASGGLVDSLGGSTSIASNATTAWVNNGTFSVTTLGLTTGKSVENNNTFSCTGLGSTSGGTFNNNSTGTFTLNGTVYGNINNFGIVNSSSLSGSTVGLANFYNKSTGVLNFTGGSMSSVNLVLDASEAGNIVNYSGTSQIVKDVVYSTLTLSGSGNKTILTGASNTLSTGTLTISGTAKATVSSTSVGVQKLFLGTAEQNSGTIGGTGSGATKINRSYFNNGTGFLNVSSSTIETIWNGTSWSNSTPTAALDAVINGTYGTADAGSIAARALIINSTTGNLTVNSGTNVTVQNEIINNGIFTIENNANLVQVNNVANLGSGTTTVNRNGSTLKRLDYTLWSSPVVAQNLKAFSSLTVDPRFYTYNEGIDKYSVVPNPAGTTFSPGISFFVRMPDQYPADSGNTTPYYLGSSTLAYPGVFTGTLNNGNVSVTLTKALNGYQAVGNPYPSVIDAERFLVDNAANIENTLYFWRKTNGSGSAYATYTDGGGTTVSAAGIAPNGKIQVGQGFIVKAKNAGTIANFFTNAMRDEAPSSTQFFKVKQQIHKDRVWLNLTSANDAFSQALVAYVADANVGLDKYDGKYINDSEIALTTSIDGDEYTIQGRPAFDATDVVALNFKTNIAGTYTIAIDHVDGLFLNGQNIYLVDKTTGTTTNLSEGAYSFTAAAGVDNTRFTLAYQKTLKVDVPLFNENSVLVSRNNGTLNVKSSAIAINNVKVYDVQGRLVAERKNVKSNTATFSNLKANQVLIVKVTAENNNVVNKKILN